jgi:hypothetical protein
MDFILMSQKSCPGYVAKSRAPICPTALRSEFRSLSAPQIDDYARANKKALQKSAPNRPRKY